MPHGLLTLVCGGRDFTEAVRAWEFLDLLHRTRDIGCIVQGGARGADTIGKTWAIHRRIPVIQVNAHWDTMGPGAGTIRNQWMIDWCRPQLVVALPGGAGTRNMLRCAANAQIEVVRLPEQ